MMWEKISNQHIVLRKKFFGHNGNCLDTLLLNSLKRLTNFMNPILRISKTQQRVQYKCTPRGVVKSGVDWVWEEGVLVGKGPGGGFALLCSPGAQQRPPYRTWFATLQHAGGWNYVNKFLENLLPKDIVASLWCFCF